MGSSVNYGTIQIKAPSTSSSNAYFSAPSNDSTYNYLGGSYTVTYVVSKSKDSWTGTNKISEKTESVTVNKDSTTNIQTVSLTGNSSLTTQYVHILYDGTHYDGEYYSIMMPIILDPFTEG